MHPKVFVKLKKTLKTLSSRQKNPKKPKKTQKTQKTQKKTKKTTGLGFFKKNPVFFQPWPSALSEQFYLKKGWANRASRSEVEG